MEGRPSTQPKMLSEKAASLECFWNDKEVALDEN
jgi:hypothetical protein